jgi:hypothetical protein
VSRTVEGEEKVPKRILGRNADKSDLIECATTNDPMLEKDQVTPENYYLIPVRGLLYRLVSGREKAA